MKQPRKVGPDEVGVAFFRGGLQPCDEELPVMDGRPGRHKGMLPGRPICPQ